jgi:pyruvate dehydrogenase E2 component (dihydrolipoamide acetyltransferase)
LPFENRARTKELWRTIRYTSRLARCEAERLLPAYASGEEGWYGVAPWKRSAGLQTCRACEGKLKPEQMQGGCFSISSLGGIGGTGFTPIINAPEVAILGAVRAELKPKWGGTQFEPRLLLPLYLSWDHRVVDGAAAARFLLYLCVLLSDFRRALL